MSGLLRLHFSNVRTADLFRHIANKHHNHWEQVLKELQGLRPDKDEKERRTTLARRAFLKWRRLAGHDPDLDMQMREGTGELFSGWTQGIAPKVEGRITCAPRKNGTAKQ